ncbi:MAG: adenylate/guanylate cyclase domain-containing protein [Saprospiraceae bacterium]|nr:adenylate/guanylate cyclase domain-containing protein [Saprospiraceae bacterium]
MNLELKIKLKKVLVIVIIWVVIGGWITCYDYFSIASLKEQGFDDVQFNFSLNLLFNCLAGFIGGTLGGSFLIFYVDEKFSERSYGYTIISVLISFILIVAFITTFLGLIFVPLVQGHSINSAEGWSAYIAFIQDPLHLKNIIAWSVVVSFTQLFLQINNKFGPGILFAFIRGKYRTPQYEERIFMFVDLKSSTTIAEKLGNELYHRLLKDFFRDLTKPIIYNKGHIYQYVGDEVVVSWKLQEGLEENHCLECYFQMIRKISEKSDIYLSRYGQVPEFKAGIHYGKVIAGEIGLVKRDITYSGDVLNTTARIQAKCNEYNTKLLISGALLKRLRPQLNHKIQSLGQILLRGKNQSVELCTLV